SSRCLSGTVGTTSSLPPRCNRKVRSETLRTCTPGRASMAAEIASAWSASDASQLTSTTITSGRDSTTSSAVSDPPAAETAAASSEVAPKVDGTSVRRVIEYPGLGLAMRVLLLCRATSAGCRCRNLKLPGSVTASGNGSQAPGRLGRRETKGRDVPVALRILGFGRLAFAIVGLVAVVALIVHNNSANPDFNFVNFFSFFS